ncbi:hypothetical protein [Bandra megavirus]|uniref:KilA-N domain-containing protein n=1 Tax=Bandra megavirus TaxID=2071566 RepID=A0A2K9V720_9VIRU|nr:hypothetical protein [Bandra megavirus]
MPKKYHKKKIYFSDSEDSFSDNNHNNNSDNDSTNEYSDDNLNTEDLNKKISKKIIKNDDESNIMNIVFERINDEYYWGQYGNFKVIMNSDGYVNVTKLCDESKTKSGGKKEFRQWKKTVDAKDLMKEISICSGISVSELLKIITTSSKHLTEIRGTYAHPQLVPHIASWASTKFGARVSVIVNEYFAKEMFDKHQDLIKKKDDKIDRLSKKIDKQTKSMKKQDEKIKLLLEKNNELMEQGNEVLGYAKDTNRKINVVVNERVPFSEEPKNEESFYIAKNNDKPSKKKDTYDYKAIRITNKSKSTTMSKYYKNHPNGEIILKIKYTPNAKHLWNACKEKIYIKDENIEPGNNAFCYFNLCGDYSERQLKKDIMRIHNKRLKTEDI